MSRVIGAGLALIGAFLVMLAVLAQTWAPSGLMKTPLDIDSTTLLEGTAELSTGDGTDTVDVRAFSVTKADSAASDEDVVVFRNSSCLVIDEGGIDGCVSAEDPRERLISATTDEFATDRSDALAVNDPDYLPAGAEEKSGLINKWPFEAEQETYPYWDGLAGEALDAEFDRTEEINGLEMNVYRVSASDVPAEISEGVQGTYSDEKELWVDPVTGSIINQVDSQERLDEDGEPFLILDLAFTDEQVDANVEDAKSNGGSLGLVTDTIPVVGYAVGIPALLIGIGLMVMSLRRKPSRAAG